MKLSKNLILKIMLTGWTSKPLLIDDKYVALIMKKKILVSRSLLILNVIEGQKWQEQVTKGQNLIFIKSVQIMYFGQPTTSIKASGIWVNLQPRAKREA